MKLFSPFIVVGLVTACVTLDIAEWTEQGYRQQNETPEHTFEQPEPWIEEQRRGL